jgi:hypothetical protein
MPFILKSSPGSLIFKLIILAALERESELLDIKKDKCPEIEEQK